MGRTEGEGMSIRRFGPIRIRTGKSSMVSKGSHGPLLRIGALSLFSETNSDGLWNIAAYHRSDSLTWRWILSFSRGRRSRGDDGRWRGGWMNLGRYRRHDGFLSEAWAVFGSWGITLHRQEDMRRDMEAQVMTVTDWADIWTAERAKR